MNAQKSLGALNAALDLTISPALSAEGILDLSGTFVGTFVLEGTADGVTYRAIELFPLVGGASVASVTAPGGWRFQLLGWKAARVRCSAYTSGSAVVACAVTAKAA